MIEDNYLVIREWVPNFVPEEDHITKLTAWVRIPKLSVEYFNKQFLLQKIGQKIGRVIKVDSTTANVERGQYTRMCIEVDLTKPLLSKFRLNGRVWGIQYEGLRMICFKCGKQGHKEDACGASVPTTQDSNPLKPKHASQTEVQERDFGSWMLVTKPTRRPQGRNQQPGARTRGPAVIEPGPTRVGHESNRSMLTPASVPNLERNPHPPVHDPSSGSRFRALETLDLNMATEDQDTEIGVHVDMAAAPNPKDGTESNLVRMEITPNRILAASNYGNGNCGDMASTPIGNHRDHPMNGHTHEAQEPIRPTTVMPQNASSTGSSTTAQQDACTHDDSSFLCGEPDLDIGRNLTGPARASNATRLRVTGRTDTPNDLRLAHPDRGKGVRQAGPPRSPQRNSLQRAVSGSRN